MNPANTFQIWKLIEEDFTLRLSMVAGEWSAKHLKEWNAVFAEGRRRGNASYYGPALVEMEIADAEKRAEWSYQTCCKIWEIQGRAKTKQFFRAIFDWCLQPMFSTREGCFGSQIELHQKRAGTSLGQGLSHTKGHLKREIAKLRAKWNTKLEIATRDAEYQVRLTPERESMADSPKHLGYSDLLRLPDGFRSSGDPVERNPFSDEDPRHNVWADATQKAEQRLRAFNAAGMGLLKDVQPTTEDQARKIVSAHYGHLVTGKFDIWAKRGVNVLWSEPEVRAFDVWLAQYANAWLNEIRQIFPPELGNIAWLLEELRILLIQRIEFWKSEARKYLIEQVEDRNREAPTDRVNQSQDYELEEDGRSVRVRGIAYKVTPGQAKMLEVLLDAYRGSNPEVTESRLKNVLGSEPKNTFRSCPLRIKGYIHVKNRRYFLVSPDCVGAEDCEKAHE